jgi:tetratricopeptide (TPR) repeat protein
LAQQPNDAKAIHNQLVALIHSDNFTKAVAYLASLPKAKQSEYVFECAYCYYRLSQLDKALDVLAKSKLTNRSALHLKAQIVSCWAYATELEYVIDAYIGRHIKSKSIKKRRMPILNCWNP